MSNTIKTNEEQRLQALKLYEVLDTLPEQEFDDITRLAAEICRTPIALISLVDEDRQWFKSRVGLDVSETPRDIAFCAHAIEGDGDIYEVKDPLTDPLYATNPLVTGFPHIRYYAGAPLVTTDGYALGTLCVINSQPHQLSEAQRNSLEILARSVITMLELRYRQRQAEFFHSALDEIAAVSVVDKDNKVEYANARFCELTGLEKEEIIDHPVSEINTADLTDEQQAEITQTIGKGEIYRNRVKDVNRHGDVAWNNLTIIPYRDYHNEPLNYFSIRIDTTAEVQTVNRFEAAERSSKIGSWELNMLNGKRYWSKNMFKLLGVSPENSTDLPFTLLDFVVPDQRAAVEQSVQDLLAGTNNPQLDEVTVTTHTGKTRIFSITRDITRDAKGKPILLSGTVQDITERKQLETELQQSLDYARQLFDNAPCGYHVLDKEGNITDISQTELEWLGYEGEEVIGKMNMRDIIDPSTIPSFEAEFAILLDTGIMKDRPRMLKGKDGSLIDTLVTASPSYNADGSFQSAVVTAYDISELKRARELLHEHEAKFRDMVEKTAQMVYTTDADGRFTYASPHVKKTLGYDDDEIIGKQFAFIYDDEWRKKTIQFYVKQLIDRTPETTYVFPVKTRDGRMIWLEQIATLVTVDDEVKGFSCVMHDITDRVESEARMQEAMRLATESKQMQQNFLSKMSHEIRTPMNGVIGMANLLKETSLTETQRKYLDGISRSADNLLRVINDILDISKIEAGKVTFEHIDFDLRETIENVISTVRLNADVKGVVVASSIDSRIPDMINADPTRLGQILLNLAGNAIKFTDRGSVIISARQAQQSKDEVVLEFKVIDSGIGIPRDKLGTIFESFTQAEDNITRRFGGTGLGLTIARQLVEQQGGSIEVESEEGRGTTFTFTFRCTVGRPVYAPVTTPPPATEVAPGMLRDYSILLVEDNDINQMVARSTLENWGAKVTIADRGRIAIDLISDTDFDVVLMDIQMPEMSGIDATKAIRKFNTTVPIIAMTASAMMGEREKCIAAGMNNYISKPFDPQELIALIRAIAHRPTNEPSNSILDLKNLLYITGDDEQIAQKILSVYVTSYPQLKETIRRGLENRDHDILFREVHILKNTLGILCNRKDINNLLSSMEQYLTGKDWPDTLSSDIQRLSSIIEEVYQAALQAGEASSDTIDT